MCQWMSAIVTRDKQVLFNLWTDSHEDLIALFGLKDDETYLKKFVRVEYSPDKPENAAKPETYSLRVDEAETPIWFDDDLRQQTIDTLSARLKRCIVTGKVKMLCGDVYVLGDGAKVDKADGCRIAAMCGGTLTEMYGGTLTKMWGGTLTAMRGGTLTAMCGGTLTEMWGGTLTEMYGGTLTEMWGGTLTAMDKKWAKIVNDYRQKDGDK